MASVDIPGFKSSAIFSAIDKSLAGQSDAAKAAQLKKVKAIFQFDVKNDAGKVQTWTLDLKKQGKICMDSSAGKPDVTIAIKDGDLVDLGTGKLNGQKAFSTGKLKVKGNIMQVTKVEGILKSALKSAKL